MTGPGEVERDRKGLTFRDDLKSLAPSSRGDMEFGDGLLEPELGAEPFSDAESLIVPSVAGFGGVLTEGDVFPEVFSEPNCADNQYPVRDSRNPNREVRAVSRS